MCSMCLCVQFAKDCYIWSVAETSSFLWFMSVFWRQTALALICCCFLCVVQEVVRQKIRRQLTKQQKAAQRRRLQKGEANLVTKSRRENQNTIKSSVESASFWGWMGLQGWTIYDIRVPVWSPFTVSIFFLDKHFGGTKSSWACVQHFLNVNIDN